jgi:hypothetical protein
MASPALNLDQAPPPPAEAAGPSRLTRWLCACGAIGVCTAGLGFVYAVDPTGPNSPYPPDLLKTATGIDCPGCGGTRGLHALLHGDFATAADRNPLVFVVVPLVLYLAVGVALDQFGIKLPAPKANRWTAFAVVAFLLVFTIVRNIPGQPLYYLNSDLA